MKIECSTVSKNLKSRFTSHGNQTSSLSPIRYPERLLIVLSGHAITASALSEYRHSICPICRSSEVEVFHTNLLSDGKSTRGHSLTSI